MYLPSPIPSKHQPGKPSTAPKGLDESLEGALGRPEARMVVLPAPAPVGGIAAPSANGAGRTWQSEFGPDYACPDCPPDFQDMSWHNDSAPGYAVLGEVGGETDMEIVRIWMEHPNPRSREFSTDEEDAPRFLVADGDVYGDSMNVVYRYKGDDFNEALAISRKVKEIHTLRMLAQSFLMADAYWHPDDYRDAPGLVAYASEDEANQQVEDGIQALLKISPELQIATVGSDGSKLAISDLVSFACRLADDTQQLLPTV